MQKRVVDLCCGIGGFSLGFKMPGFSKAMKEANRMWRQEIKARKVKAEAMSP